LPEICAFLQCSKAGGINELASGNIYNTKTLAKLEYLFRSGIIYLFNTIGAIQ
jgi:hypothetical protein